MGDQPWRFSQMTVVKKYINETSYKLLECCGLVRLQQFKGNAR